MPDTLEELTNFGDGGRQPGQFFGVHSIATDSKGNIYTTETYEGKRVQKFVYKGMGPVRTMNQGPAEVVGLREGIIVEKVNQLARSRLQGRIALDRRLVAARDDDFQPVSGIIQRAGRGGCGNICLSRSRRDDWSERSRSTEVIQDRACGDRVWSKCHRASRAGESRR